MESVNVYESIESERRYQDRKWGTVEQHPHEVRKLEQRAYRKLQEPAKRKR